MSAEQVPTLPDQATVTPRLQFIDGLRGVAVMMVVVFHAAVWGGLPVEGLGQYYLFEGRFPIELGRLRHILSLGGAGVDIFLAVSGFCLFWPLVKHGDGTARTLHIPTYLQRRTRRIVPPYYFGLAAVFLCSYLTYSFQGPSWWPWAPNSFQNAFPLQDDWWLNVGTHLLLIHGLFNSYINAYEGAYWSLSLEWQFYFLFIPLAYLARRAGILWAVLVPIVGTALFRGACGLFFPQFLSTPVGHLFSLSRWVEFGGGMLAAAIVSGSLPPRLIQNFASLARLRGLYLLVSVAVALVLEYTGARPQWLPFAWANASLALIVAGAQTGWWSKVLKWRPLVWLGTISYSLYLTHGMVYMAMALILSRTEISRDVRQSIYLLLGPWIAVAFSALFFQLFEKPFLSGTKLKRKEDGQLVPKNTATVQDQAAP
jgi:peptidoglycan/LPS O-acetylase OafA/YrhL